ncbi:hypothetical protein DFP72DRAFT_1104289 [Ephemerocybe angulata]|uniref:Uncharacterized protein n=1 Tax=Ephemerocybe angulata TaxID=980116 RepID=A0A8H6I817_9AGAR|nr:hypothetical protein DFP72DRAFT_1104275 [Tulosesus angulatus]KAF6759046.1 hypothetical protein DFP72DRAFT_1104286 [Tulosesus angulatus]KAF6759051.1 hypothetical protein DFP72DRAFT_1104289 [Tulosesus angulatus]
MAIALSSGLSGKDIERMVSQADEFAEYDKERHAFEEGNKADSGVNDAENTMNEFAEYDKERHAFEEGNKADSGVNDAENTMNDFKDQLDKTKVEKLFSEFREVAAKRQAGDNSITADSIREKISETQQASLGLFKKVYEKRARGRELVRAAL